MFNYIGNQLAVELDPEPVLVLVKNRDLKLV